MKHRRHVSIFFTLIMLVFLSSSVQAWEWLSLYPVEIEAILNFDGTDRRSNDSEDTRDTEWQAGVRVNQEGYILDPGIAWFQLELEPVYIWGKFDSKTEPQDHSGDILSYLFQLNMLHGTPGAFSYDLYAMRTRNFNTGSFGGRDLTDYETMSAAVNWKNQAFPMRFIYEERSLVQEFLTGQTGSLAQRDEKVRTMTARGRSSKMNLLVEHQSVDDRVPGRDLDFDVNRADLAHTLPWGNNSYLRSRLDYYDRTGFNENKRLTIEETAHIQHTENVYSQSIYRFFSITQNFQTTEHNGEFQITHQLYNNLITSANVFGSSLHSDPLDETRLRAGVESQYNKQDLFGANISAGLGYSYMLTDRDSSLGLVEVVDEAHITTLGGGVILNQRFIVTATIIVTSADGTLVYTEGIDYIVLDLSDDLTQLQIIPGGRIEIGTTILVSYKAIALPSQEFSTTFTKVSLGIDFGWLRFSHYDRKSDDKLLSGAGESFLNPYRDIVTEVEFQWDIARFDILVGAERRFSRFSEFESTTYTYRQLLTWSSANGTLWNLNIIESFTDANNLDTDLYSLELSTSWQPLPSLSIRPTLGAWKRFDSGEVVIGGQREDQFYTAGFSLRWYYRKVALDLAYHHNSRITDSQQFSQERQTDEDRLMFNLSRRF